MVLLASRFRRIGGSPIGRGSRGGHASGNHDPSMTPGAVRSRRYRRRNGLEWVYPVPVRSRVLEALIDRGLPPAWIGPRSPPSSRRFLSNGPSAGPGKKTATRDATPVPPPARGVFAIAANAGGGPWTATSPFPLTPWQTAPAKFQYRRPLGHFRRAFGTRRGAAATMSMLSSATSTRGVTRPAEQAPDHKVT